MKMVFLAYGVTDAEGNFEVKSWNDGKMPVSTYNVSANTPLPHLQPAYNPLRLNMLIRCALFTLLLLQILPSLASAQAESPSAKINGEGPGWKTLGEADFVMVNGKEDTWKWEGSLVKCTGKPVGVTRSQKQYKNFELVANWRHLSKAGNSGIFIWAPESVLKGLPLGSLPGAGIEVQVLDHGYTEQYEKSSGKKADWFTTHGDVFPVGASKMVPFPPVAPDGARSFPRENHSKPTPEWNHYYVRAINGEVRLWVNGIEVSGGNKCTPSEGFLCLESEGAPVEFKEIRLRELP